MSPAPPRASEPLTPEQQEAQYLSFAEYIVGLICGDAAACNAQRCRRMRMCGHLIELRSAYHGWYRQPATRRSPGAQAVRLAMWLYMTNTDNEG